MKFSVRIGVVTTLMPIHLEFSEDNFNGDNSHLVLLLTSFCVRNKHTVPTYYPIFRVMIPPESCPEVFIAQVTPLVKLCIQVKFEVSMFKCLVIH